MKKLLATSVVAIMAVLSTGARAATAEGQGNAKAKLATGVVVEEKEVMDFGTITRAGSDVAGTVTLAIGGGLTSSDDVNIHPATTGTAGVVEVRGSKDTAISGITYGPATLATATGETVGVTVSGTTSADLSATGKATLNVGGILTLAGGEPDGEYSTETTGGSPYTVTVEY